MQLFKKQILDKKGVALLLVIGGLMIITTVVVEFAYQSRVTYHAAFNQLDRSQAYYLANSGIGFAKLLLKYNKEIQKIAAAAAKKAGTSIIVPPLYELIPINTGLIRGLSEGLGELAPEGQASPEAAAMNFLDLKSAKEFLDFKGDFAIEIIEEDAKININAFYSTDPKSPSYDVLKSSLYYLLIQEEFTDLLEDRYRDAKDLSQSIADFIDPDDAYNQAGGHSRGREGLGAKGDERVMKNAKLLTLEELNLVPGMRSDLYEKLQNYLTVYGGEAKFNFCRAPAPVQQAFVMAYAERHSQYPSLSIDNQDLVDQSLNLIVAACPETSQMEAAFKELFEAEASSGINDSNREDKVIKNPKFTDLIKEDSSLYKVISTGEAGLSRVRVFTVIDASSSSSKNFKEIYWRVL